LLDSLLQEINRKVFYKCLLIINQLPSSGCFINVNLFGDFSDTYRTFTNAGGLLRVL